MENQKEFLSKLEKIEKQYSLSPSEQEKDVINIFSVLHKEHNEKLLHSRFISWLLSSDSSHKQNIFLELFLEIVGIKINLENIEVFPKHNGKEYDKKEYEDIDILIINRQAKQAIIIENKINADDQPKQLANYVDKIKSEKELGKNAQIFVRYLTLYKEPSNQTFGDYSKEEINFDKIYYWDKIKLWLEKCLENSSGDLHNYIQQYYILIKKIAQTRKYIEIKQLMATDLSLSKILVDNSTIKSEDFKHIKWHTVHECWSELKNELEKYYKNVKTFPEENTEFNKIIAKVTHKNKNENHGILFEIATNKTAYISGLNNLSWGILETETEPKQWFDFQNEKLQNIRFSDFSIDNTFDLISIEIMLNAVELIANEILWQTDDKFRSSETRF
jgi:hypothetical protein